MGRFQNSIALAKASFAVLREDKKLALLPLISGVVTLIVAASFLIPSALVAHDSATGGYDAKPVTILLALLGYIACAFVVVLFNSALVYAADAKLHGVTVSIGDAVRFAWSRAHILLPWALVSATVSIALRAVRERGGIFGAIVGAIAGIAWSLVTFLVLPVLVVEGLGPFKAVKRSAELFKRAWGEQVISNAGIGLIALFAILAGAVVMLPFLLIGGPAIIVGVALFVVWVIAVSLVASALTGILQIALYRYATEGQVPGWDNTSLQDAFTPRNRRGFLN
jgi:hypothetical protein